MSKKPDGGPAVPGLIIANPDGSVVGAVRGINLRDYFANTAFAALLSGEAHYYENHPSELAETAYKFADVMLRERIK